ncbi:MAG: hypothetical protein AAFN70_05560, partial [Planctomycetota bacterium]
QTTKEQKVQVCRMVPRLVEEVINPCCDATAPSAGPAVTGGSIIQGGVSGGVIAPGAGCVDCGGTTATTPAVIVPTAGVAPCNCN